MIESYKGNFYTVKAIEFLSCFLEDLNDSEYSSLEFYLKDEFNWLTGIGLLDAVDGVVQQSKNNGLI